MTDTPLVPGRSCGSCTLCCKLLRIDELDKPKGEWCEHCAVGKGCRIYDERPAACRGFFCGYRTQEALSDEWFPSKAKLMVFPALDGSRINVVVDPARPDAWRAEPYYSGIKAWAQNGAGMAIQVAVSVGKRLFAILPDEDADLGIVSDEDRVIYYEVDQGGRRVLKAKLEKGES